MKMNTVSLVFIGGGLGSICRYYLSKYLNNHSDSLAYGTLLSNFLASLILGFFINKALENNFPIRPFILIGFCGGFSTFSTFSFENFTLMQNGNYHIAFLNILANVLLCLFAIYLGIEISK